MNSWQDVHVYIINLPGCPDRLRRTRDQLTSFGFKRMTVIPAVDGNEARSMMFFQGVLPVVEAVVHILRRQLLDKMEVRAAAEAEPDPRRIRTVWDAGTGQLMQRIAGGIEDQAVQRRWIRNGGDCHGCSKYSWL
ncbi:MAG: hypothetical protein EBX55_07150 [Betaproteobacteria bacterium]|nr:hypothetical protein [Betaproteobacteria bacterium]